MNKKKAIIFCEGNILHREYHARHSINELSETYEILALVDRQSSQRFLLSEEKSIPVFKSIREAVLSSSNVKDPIFLSLGMDAKSELLLFVKSAQGIDSLGFTTSNISNLYPDIPGNHIQD